MVLQWVETGFQLLTSFCRWGHPGKKSGEVKRCRSDASVISCYSPGSLRVWTFVKTCQWRWLFKYNWWVMNINELSAHGCGLCWSRAWQNETKFEVVSQLVMKWRTFNDNEYLWGSLTIWKKGLVFSLLGVCQFSGKGNPLKPNSDSRALGHLA